MLYFRYARLKNCAEILISFRCGLPPSLCPIVMAFCLNLWRLTLHSSGEPKSSLQPIKNNSPASKTRWRRPSQHCRRLSRTSVSKFWPWPHAAAVSGQFGNLGAKKNTYGGRNNPSAQSLMVTRRAKPPSPSPSITRRRTPAAPSGWGSFFSGHRRRRGRIRAAKNEFCRPPSSGLRTCTIRDEDLMVPVIEGEGSGRSA
jgi:hypothetical protein